MVNSIQDLVNIHHERNWCNDRCVGVPEKGRQPIVVWRHLVWRKNFYHVERFMPPEHEVSHSSAVSANQDAAIPQCEHLLLPWQGGRIKCFKAQRRKAFSQGMLIGGNALVADSCFAE